jgi:hypothetical protein
MYGGYGGGYGSGGLGGMYGGAYTGGPAMGNYFSRENINLGGRRLPWE